MANKDGVVSIGFDYKKELDEVCATIEKELNNLGGDINLSDGIKKQMAEIKKMITDMKKDIGSSFDKITETKLDTKTFETFKKDVNKRIREVNKEVSILKEQFSALDGSANVNGIVQQFANLKKHVEDSNASISEFISNSEKLGKSVVISSTLNTDELQNDVLEIKKLLTDINKEDLDFGYTNKSTKELTNDLEGLVDKYYRITDLIDEMKSSMNGIDATTQEYKNQEVQLSKLSLELLKCSAQMDDLFGAKNAEKINVDKIISVDELDDIFSHMQNISSKIKLEAKNIVESIELSNTAVKNVGNNTISDLSNKSNIELHISTKQSTINKQLDEMIDNLQQRAANKPIIAPVKLRVDSEYEKTTKNSTASALTENQINEARKDVESVVPGLEKAFNNSMRIATNKAVETAKESIKAVREFFESNPITVHLTIPDDEKAKIGKAILSEDGKTTVNISGEVDKARKSVKGLSEDLEKSQLLIKENAQNAKNLSLEKLVNSLSETMSQFSELKGIITSIQNMENTIARASGISSTNELVEQWSIVEKTIINATKLDGDFRKNANIGKIVSEYQKYIDMGGTNTLSGIDKIKDNESTINSILSKMKELKIHDVENDSIQKLSVDLDGVIAKFDELISTVKTATNALYKIIRDGNVSDLDKQWSSISNKFKSIADESGKINLSKQKTDIKELMDMYQKYTNAGGINSLMSLTDNVETLRKLDKEYQKLNQAQSVDNSSTIEKESKSFDKVEKSVDSLTTAIGDTKVQAINIEATAMEDAAEREIVAIRSILDNLDLIVSRLKDIKGIKLPKIEVKNVDVVEKAVESLANAGNKSNISSANETPKSIENTTNAITEQTNALKELILSWVEAQKVMSKSGSASTEKIAVGNLSNGFVSNSNFTGDLNSISDKLIRNIIENATETVDTIIHSHPDYNLAAFSPEDIASSIIRFATGIQNQIIVGMDEISIMDVSKIKDINPLEIKNKIEQELSSLINSYIKNQLQSIDSLQRIFVNNFSGGLDEWSTFTDLISENTNSDFLKNVIQKYKDSISDALINMGSDYKFSNSDELGTFIYENVIKKYVRSYVSNSNPDINQSEYDALQKEALENFKKEFSAIYDKAFSIKDYESLLTDNEIQPIVKEAFSNILKTFGLKYEDVIKTISVEQLRTSSISPMKDVFQGDKIDQATTSAKELDKTLEQVNIPTDSFDEVLSKLDLTKSELKEIVKITKQSVSDSEGKFHDSYTLKDKLGSTEIYGLSSNTEKGQLLRSNIVGYDAKAEAQEAKRLVEENIRLNKAYYDSKKQEEAEYQRLRAKYLAEGKAQEEKYYADLKKSRESSLKSYQDQINSFDKQIPKKPIDGQRSDKFESLVQDYKNAIEEARKYLDTLGDSPVTKEVKDEWERLIGVIKKAKEEMDAVPNAARGSDADSRTKEIDKLTKYLDKNTRISKEAREQLEGYLALLKNDDPSVNVKELHTAWTKVAVAEREAGREGKSFLDIFKNKVVYNYAAQLAGYYLSFMDMIRYARNAVSAVQELDTALIDLKKTTTMSASELERFYYDSNDVAKQMGTTTAEIINQASAWSRLGYSTKEASTQMAELSAQFAAISPDLDLDSATDGLVSSMKAFDIEVTNVERDIMDNINRIGNTAATSNGEIVDMLTRSSAAMAAANNTIQETIALETAAVEITRNAETTGTAFKTKFCLYVQKCAYRKYLIAGNA